MTWKLRGCPILHWPADPDWSRPAKIRGGDPLLFPFIARTYLDGQIGRWRDSEGVVREAPMHGFARDRSFRVIHQSAAALRIAMGPDDDTRRVFPFDFQFEVAFVLEPQALQVEVCVSNAGTEVMPFSFGHHFYFHVPAAERGAWQLDCPCETWARQSAEGQIVPEVNAGPSLPLDDPRLVDLFHVRPELSSVALRQREEGRVLRFASGGAVASVRAWHAVTTWTESAEADFFCVEPWSALPGAIHGGDGLIRLAPGESAVLPLRIIAENW